MPPTPQPPGSILIPPLPTLGPTDTLMTFSGTSTRTESSPVFQITDAVVIGPGNLFAVAPGANASLAGPLAQVTGSTLETSVLNAGASVLDVQGRLQSTGELPLFVIDPTLVIAANLVSVGPGGNLVLAGPLLVDSGGGYVVSGALLSIFGGGNVTGSSPTALLQFTGSTMVTGQALSVVDGTATVGGTLLRFSGGTLNGTTTLPLLSIDRSTVASGQNLLSLSGTDVFFTGSLLDATSTTLRTGDPQTNVHSLVFIGDGARVTSTTTGPLLSFDASSVDSSGGILSLRRSPSALEPSTLTLAGPLFSATNGSTFNTSSLGFASSFLTTPGACCAGFSVTQGAVLESTTTAPLIQLSGSTFSAGPDAQSGGNFFNVSDRVVATELIAPATSGSPGRSLAPPAAARSGRCSPSSGSTIRTCRAPLRSRSSSSPGPR